VHLTAVLPGTSDCRPASTHVRVLRRLRHPVVRSRIAATVLDGGGRLALPARTEAVLVQRTAVPGEHAEKLVARLERRRIFLVVDLDDDLFATRSAAPEDGPALEGLAVLLEHAALVTVSTEVLRRRLVDRAKHVVLVPNMLDEQLWLRRRHRRREASERLRLVYVGTRTHSADLALLRPVLERLRDKCDLDVELHVVGGELESDGPQWYSRVSIPPESANYPEFVKWLKSQAHRWDIAVAPLVDDHFNRAKSDLKFLEYSALSLPGVYSTVEPYETCIDGITAVTTPNTVRGWCSALQRLAADSGLRKRIADAAREYVRTERTLGASARAYADLLAEPVVTGQAVSRSRPPSLRQLRPSVTAHLPRATPRS
jgi:glycosyltransferase involved in cell wall biosynthesis